MIKTLLEADPPRGATPPAHQQTRAVIRPPPIPRNRGHSHDPLPAARDVGHGVDANNQTTRPPPTSRQEKSFDRSPSPATGVIPTTRFRPRATPAAAATFNPPRGTAPA